MASNLNIVAIIQARMGLTRLPGKVMKNILGKPMILWDLDRVSISKLIDAIVVAIPYEKENDVLDRYYQAAVQSNADGVALPVAEDNVRHAWHLYTILLDESINRDEFFKYMRSGNIGVNLHYILIYRHSYYLKHFGINPLKNLTMKLFSRI